MYRQYARELFDARVTPIGQAPNGMRFSGYCCRNEASGHLILFMEQTQEAEYSFDVPVFLRDAEMTVLYESAPVSVTCETGRVRARFEKSRSFIWIRYEL